jgi:hypothetical protein
MMLTYGELLPETPIRFLSPAGENALHHGIGIRPVRVDDFETIETLFRKTGDVGPSAPVWSWLWRENPALDAVSHDHPAGWVIIAREEAGSPVVGYLGNVIERCYHNGRAIPTATAAFGTVLPAYRKHAAKLIDAFMIQSDVAPLQTDAFTRDNVSSYGQVSQGQADRMAAEAIGERRCWAIKPRNAAGPLASLIRKVRGNGVARPGGSQPDLNTLLPAQIGARFDTLWKQLRAASNSPLIWRDARTLRWRCGNPDAQTPIRMITCSRTIHLLGYAVMTGYVNPVTGISRARIIDLQCGPAAPANVRDWLLWAAARQARADGHHVLELCDTDQALRFHFDTRIP